MKCRQIPRHVDAGFEVPVSLPKSLKKTFQDRLGPVRVGEGPPLGHLLCASPKGVHRVDQDGTGRWQREVPLRRGVSNPASLEPFGNQAGSP